MKEKGKRGKWKGHKRMGESAAPGGSKEWCALVSLSTLSPPPKLEGRPSR